MGGGIGSGCAHGPDLVPASTASPVAGHPLAATAAGGGIVVSAFTDTWNGTPSDLKRSLTPIEVKLENKGDRPVRVRFNEFALATEDGYKLAPLPPYDIRSAASIRSSPAFMYRGFALAPYYPELFYPGVPLWPHPWLLDEAYYGANFTQWPQALPTRDLIEKALPEGVIDPQGMVTGFLYFPALRPGRYPLNLEMTVVEAEGKELGRVSIPFTVER